MQPEIHIPCSDRRPPRRPSYSQSLYFQPRETADTSLRSRVSVSRADFAITSAIGFQVTGFDVRWPRIAAAAFMIAIMLPLTAQPQSLWRADASRPMFADKKAVTSGDILTVVVQETTTTTKNNKTATSKSSSVDASVSSFFYNPTATKFITKNGQLPALQFDAKNDYSGGGTINNSENIIARVAVQVVDVLPNGNLVIEGQRETAFSGERQTVVLHGVVRPEDVTAQNTVLSYNIFDATIQVISKGTITDSQRKGWFNRIWDKLSPF